MGVSLSIKNVPEDWVERLRERADRHHRSLQGELMSILELTLESEKRRTVEELLEEIRVITNLVQNGEPRVRLVLTGGTRLEERMSHPQMESLNQRVVARL